MNELFSELKNKITHKYRINFWKDRKTYPKYNPVAEYIITAQDENTAIKEATIQFSKQLPDLDLKEHIISSEDSL